MNSPIDIIQNDSEVPVGVFGELLSEWRVPFRVRRPDLEEDLPARMTAMIVLGGVMGVHDEAKHPFLADVKRVMRQALVEETPLLGICLGGQLLAEVAGGVVTSNRCGEKGLVEVVLTANGAADPLFRGVAGSFRAFQWHNDSFAPPLAAQSLARSVACPGQAFRIGNAWGVQFHPEVDGDIVAAWSRRDAEQQRLTAEFTVAERFHRQLARQLLGNFLTLAGLSRPA